MHRIHEYGGKIYEKRIFLYILIFLLLSPVMYCILLISFGLPMYWLPPLHRDKQVSLEKLLIKPEDLSGQWVIQDDPYYDDDYGWSKYHEDNLGYSLNNITETEGLFHQIIRNWNIPVAEFRYNEIYKDEKHVFGTDSDFHNSIKIGQVQKMGDHSDIICFKSKALLRTHCMIFSRIDEYVVRINFGIDGSVISNKELEQKRIFIHIWHIQNLLMRGWLWRNKIVQDFGRFVHLIGGLQPTSRVSAYNT